MGRYPRATSGDGDGQNAGVGCPTLQHYHYSIEPAAAAADAIGVFELTDEAQVLTEGFDQPDVPRGLSFQASDLPAVRAALTTDTGVPNTDILWRATPAEAGDIGNDITVEYVDPGAAGESLSVAVVERAIAVTLATSPEVAAAATTALAGANNDLVYTAKTAGEGGNDITVEYVDPGAVGASLSVDVVADAIAVNLATSPAVAATRATALVGDNNDLLYTAKAAGVGGNDITVAYVDPGAPGASLSVDVLASAIAVNLATTPAVASAATTALVGDNNDLVYTAKTAGVAGDGITVAYVDPAAPGASLSVDVVASAIAVNLATTPAVKSALTTALVGDNNDLVYTAKTAGVAGDGITVAYAVGGLGTLLTVDVLASAITVNVATDGGGLPTSTATEVAAAVALKAEAAALVDVANAGGNTGVGVVTALVATNLAGGDDGGAITSTAALVAAAVALKAEADALVAVANAGGNTGVGVVTALVATNLAGGDDGGVITSTAALVAAAVALKAEADALVAVANAPGNSGAGVVTALVATNLTGGDDGGAITSTAALVAAAVANKAEANALVGVANAGGNTGAGVVTAMAATPLAGGDDGGDIISTAAQVFAIVNGDGTAGLLVQGANAGGSSGAGVVPAMAADNLTGGEDADTVTVTVVGTDIAGQAITQEVELTSGAATVGVRAFKTITSIGLTAIDEGHTASVTIGTNVSFGLPSLLARAADILFAFADSVRKTVGTNPGEVAVTASATLSLNVWTLTGDTAVLWDIYAQTP